MGMRGDGVAAACRAIMVPLYKNKDAVKVEAPLPKHMREALPRSAKYESQPKTQRGG